MSWELSVFLSTAVFTGMMLAITGMSLAHVKSLKKMELEKYKAQQANLQEEVEKAVGREFKKLKQRVEVLEAIVTDKNYELSEKITQLK